MNGSAMMLKSFGIDPNAIGKVVEAVQMAAAKLDSIDAKLQSIERRLTSIETMGGVKFHGE